ncbi:UNVERIFIED_CONTAM: hypothetical protein K2H54_059453 [Gekko kuhli]
MESRGQCTGKKKKKAQPQKKLKQKLPKKRKQRKQERRKRAGRQTNKVQNPKKSSSMFVPKILRQLCQEKAPLPAKDNEKTVFSQRCFLASQDGQQQCYLSNYVSSQAACGTMDSLNVPMVTVGPCKPAVTRWTATISPPQQSALTSQLWPEGQQQYVFCNAAPSQAPYHRMSTVGTKELHYEANERMPRQSVMCLFANKPSNPGY